MTKQKKINEALVFLLPMLKFKFSMVTNIENAYFQSEEDLGEENKYKERIYLVYKMKALTTEEIEKLVMSEYYTKHTYLNSYIIFSYKVPEEYFIDYLLYKKGKFTLFTSKYKNLLLTTYHNTEQYDILERILYPSKADREQLSLEFNVDDKIIKELRSIPNDIESTFRRSNFYSLKF